MTRSGSISNWRDYASRCQTVLSGAASTDILKLRQCGDCQMCCHAPYISSQEILPHERPIFAPKAAGEKCGQCSAKGCGIYHNRPSICQGYMCLWLCGLTDRSPKDAGVCWTFQPDKATGMTMVKGHALDIDEVLRDVDNRQDMRNFMEYPGEVLGGEFVISSVVISSPKHVVRFDALGALPDLMADVDQTDPLKSRVLENTRRRAQWSIK